MRINSKGTVGGFPALLVRKLVRALTNRLYWDLETVESTRDRWQFGKDLGL
jgi:tRNA A58 N-methylase Trm61